MKNKLNIDLRGSSYPLVASAYFLFMLMLLLSGLGCGKNTVDSDVDNTIKFAVIGDRTGLHEEGIYRKVIDQALANDPDFLIDCGDMIEGGTEKWAVLDYQWNEYKNLISDIAIPFYHTPGNHDLWFDGQIWQYMQHIGSPYYSIDYKDIHIIVLDNSRWDENSFAWIDYEQFLWLDNDLYENENEMIIVFMHKPFWDRSIKDSILINPFHNYFLDKGVDAIFAGHYHNHFLTEYDGILYAIVGRSGGASVLGHPDFTPKDIRYVMPDEEHHSFYDVEISDGEIKINYNELECK